MYLKKYPNEKRKEKKSVKNIFYLEANVLEYSQGFLALPTNQCQFNSGYVRLLGWGCAARESFWRMFVDVFIGVFVCLFVCLFVFISIGETPLSHKLCVFRYLEFVTSTEVCYYFQIYSGKLLLSQRQCYFRRSRFSLWFKLWTALHCSLPS